MSDPAVICSRVGKIWAASTERAHEALRETDLSVDPGEFVVLLGPSGCGKSTLLYLIAGLEEPTGGEICAHGMPVTGPAPEWSLIFQETSLFPWLSVWQNVAFGLLLRGIGKAEQRESAPQLAGVGDEECAVAKAVAVGALEGCRGIGRGPAEDAGGRPMAMAPVAPCHRNARRSIEPETDPVSA